MSDPTDDSAFTLSSPTGAGTARAAEQGYGSPRAMGLAELIEQMASGRQEALGHLYDETSRGVNGLVLRILELPQDAEEVLLDVYMKAWKNARDYSPERGSVEAWLFAMARSIAIDRIRQRRSRPNTVPLEFPAIAEPSSGSLSPEEQTRGSQRRTKVQSLLQELPAEQRAVVTLAYFGGLTHVELADRLGQPLGTVKSRLRMGLLRLRTLMGGGSHAMKQSMNPESFPIEQQEAAALAAMRDGSSESFADTPRELVERFRTIVSLLAESVTPVAPGVALKQRLMSRAADYEMFKPIADVRRDEGEWTPSGSSGVDVRVLYRDASGRRTMLVRMQPGATLPAHRHHDDEQCLVLRGDVRWSDVVYEQEDFVVMGKDSDHPEIRSVNGNILLVIAGRNEFREEQPPI